MEKGTLVALLLLSLPVVGQTQIQDRRSLPTGSNNTGSVAHAHDASRVYCATVGQGITRLFRSQNMGDTFETPILLGAGTASPSIGVSAQASAASWTSNGQVSISFSFDGWETFQTVTNISTFTNLNEQVHSRLIGSTLHVCWVRQTATPTVYYRAVDLLQPISMGEQAISVSAAGGIADLAFEADTISAYAMWRRPGGQTFCNAKTHASPTWPSQNFLGTGADTAVAGAGGTAWFFWIAGTGLNVSQVMGASWSGGSLSSNWVVMSDGSSPTSAPIWGHTEDLVACASGSRYYVATTRFFVPPPPIVPSEYRVTVASTNGTSPVWTEVPFDNDALSTPNSAQKLAIASHFTGGASMENHVALVWTRTTQDPIPTNFVFAKSLDGGLTWLSTCMDPLCNQPVSLGSFGAGSPSLCVDGDNASTCYAQSGGGIFHHLISGYMPFDVCDANAPLVCGGSPGTTILGSSTPWTDPVSGTRSAVVQVATTLSGYLPVLVFTLAGNGRLSSPQLPIFGYIPHIDLANAGTIGATVVGPQQASYSVPIPDSGTVATFGVKVYLQAAYVDPNNPLPVAGWTNGLELRIN